MDLGLTFTVKEDYVPLHKIITKTTKIYGKTEASAPKIHIRQVTLHYPCIMQYINI